MASPPIDKRWTARDHTFALPARRQPPEREGWIGQPSWTLPPLPTHCPRCTAELLPATIELYLQSVPAVRCPMCGYLTDQQMLQNRMDAEAERAVERMSA